MKKIIKLIEDKEKKLDNFHFIKVAYDEDLNTLVLIKDITNNMDELKSGVTWLDIYQDLELNEALVPHELKSGIYNIEFIAWGWNEPDTEAGYGCGDSDLELVSIEEDKKSNLLFTFN